jgi:hypothetical protein
MRVIIAGSRTITDKRLINEAIHRSGFTITELIVGKAKGVDTIAEELLGSIVPVREHPADWETHGKAAGFIRNKAMLEDGAEAVIIIHDGFSKGCMHMYYEAIKMGLPVFYMLHNPQIRPVNHYTYTKEPSVVVAKAHRPYVLQNPYPIETNVGREAVCNLFHGDLKHWIATKTLPVEIKNELNYLIRLFKEGKQIRLMCFCYPKQCHTESIAVTVLSRIEGNNIPDDRKL